MERMREYFNDNIIKNLDFAAPSAGGGVTFLSMVAEWSPVISVCSVIIGVALGFSSWVYKRKAYALEVQKHSEEKQIRDLEIEKLKAELIKIKL